ADGLDPKQSEPDRSRRRRREPLPSGDCTFRRRPARVSSLLPAKPPLTDSYFHLLSTFANHIPNLHLLHYLQHSIHSHLPPSLLNDFPVPHGDRPILPTSM